MSTFRFQIGIRTLATLLAVLALSLATQVHAATTAPQRMIYNARLLNSAGTAITSAHTIRFSFWKSADEVSTDITGTGAINTGASNYASWNEVQTVTPDSNGYFSVSMGSGTALPSMDSLPASTLLSLYLQVEVKASSSANTAYEILDPKPLSSSVDRSPVLSVPFALNADRLDQHDVGTGSGSIPLLLSGGLLPIANVPGGTNRDTFVLDSNNSASSAVTLQFGDTVNKTLLYSITNNRFEFNANVRVGGNLTVTGLINGIDLSSVNIQAPLRAFSGGGLLVSVFSGSYRVNGTVTNYGGTGVTVSNNADTYIFFTSTGFVARASGFPTNVSFIPVAKVTTANGGVASVSDRRVFQSDNREHSALDVLHPGYDSSAYDADGSNNTGQLSVDHDGTSKNNFYQWTTTKGTLNDYDLVVRYTLPQKFIRWQSTPFKLYYRTSSSDSAVSKADIEVYDTAGNAVTLGGTSTNLTSTSWTSTSLTFSGSPAWTAGQTFIMKIRLSAKNAATVHIGDLELSTVELDQQ